MIILSSIVLSSLIKEQPVSIQVVFILMNVTDGFYFRFNQV
ncbi:hypothetical protein EJK51_0471 [Moraxella catarrhalis]|uniref:Uncharacterized protein n=1 Tax=Moraxella catarrhalis TaxID=480 RepID=A0A3Q9GFX6_MORCA|nr:hypothetical protein EJK52_0472 [Moraxella catarrhalis]AZQ91598.1 hypothetical protein EJK51_0471 [Moraxella catarrhalis]AZQ93186.1 hypothetical protein EJK53_0467 [Moraxella catarrhalis]AZQ95805.1 hypothetical protein EJK48_0470 [Moraxella catarrhalis]RUO14530.1 hypothetical protein EJK49_1672 [Moraxella catarrhalis]